MKFVFFMIVGMFMFTGCTTKLEKEVIENIAEIREFVFYEKLEGMSASLVCGKREKDYKMNGYATELIPFGVITVTIESIDSVDITNSKFILYVGTIKYEGELVRNPFDDTLVADIGVIIDREKNVSIDVFVNNTKTSMKLTDVGRYWEVTSMDCVGILIDYYKDELKSFFAKNFEGEVYVKIMNDYDKYSSDFYYYVTVVGRNGSSLNMIISTVGEVLASSLNIMPNAD